MNLVNRVASRFAADHKSVALMKFLSGVATRAGVGEHIYVVGGAVRNHLLGVPVKDIDVVVDSIALEGRDSDWFAKKIGEALPVPSNITTNQYGVAVLTIKGEWDLDGYPMYGEVIEIANARKESYSDAGGKGKGYKPTDVSPATIREDVYRREFTFNTLLWRLLDLADGPDRAEIVDITGLGRSHLEQKLIQTPLSPDRTFSDDPTRMLRAIKFLVKYGLKISPEVEASIRKNASKLKQMPWEAVAIILVRDILTVASPLASLRVMQELGLIAVLAEMIQEEKPFAAYMAGQFNSGNHDVALLLGMADLGLGSRPIDFLSAPQQARLRVITTPMESEEAKSFLAVLRKPPVNNEALIAEFSLVGRDRSSIVALAREALLGNPAIVGRADSIEDAVRAGLMARAR